MEPAKIDGVWLRQILHNVHTIAVVGISDKPARAGFYVPDYLKNQGYMIVPVNPFLQTWQGLKAYPDLAAVPVPIDEVLIFRKSEDVPPVVAQAVSVGAHVVWMQEGIVNEPAADEARSAGLEVVMDLCMLKVHQKLVGKRVGD